jgi:hypothetical protein
MPIAMLRPAAGGGDGDQALKSSCSARKQFRQQRRHQRL